MTPPTIPSTNANSATGDCVLCGLPTKGAEITDPGVDGAFCCQGCLAVHQALSSSAISKEDLTENSEPPETDAVTGETCFLAIDGMHCTTCESFLSARGRSIAGIHEVKASYVTDTAKVTFDPAILDADAVSNKLTGYGYAAQPRRETLNQPTQDTALISFLVGGGLFGMMVMVWYAIFLYPTYFGYDPIVSLGGLEGIYIYANIWLFSTFVLFYTGWPILRGAIVSLRARAPNMDLLVSTAALSAYLYSTLAMGLGRSDLYFDVSVAIILIVTAGTYYEGRMKRLALGDLLTTDITTDPTVRLTDGRTVQASEVTSGDEVIVRHGDRIPLDGTITDGNGAIDTALLTGEPHPVDVTAGDDVPGGAIVATGTITVQIGAEASSTRDRLLEQLWAIQTDSPGIQRFADRLATIFVPLVVFLAIVVAAGLLFTGSTTTTALLVGLTVLIVACPCALGLATPLAIAAGLRASLARGIIVAKAAVFEQAPDIDIVVLDKTGTLTDGTMTVDEVIAEDRLTLLSRAAAVEQYSNHPLAKAIVAHAEDTISWSPTVQTDGGTSPASVQIATRGLDAVVDGVRVLVGDSALFRERGYAINSEIANVIAESVAAGEVPVLVGWEGEAKGVIRIQDRTRDVAEAAISRLAEEHEVVILTGDDGPAAEQFRTLPGVSHVFSGVPPAGKAATISRLQQQGAVAMVGDGSNDAPALARADLGIALATGTALASTAADVIIEGDDLDAIADLFAVVEGTNRRIRQNLGWAFVYNGIAIPLAILGLLNPFLAAVAMAMSSILVISNTARAIAPG